jgi:hypothetical protein
MNTPRLTLLETFELVVGIITAMRTRVTEIVLAECLQHDATDKITTTMNLSNIWTVTHFMLARAAARAVHKLEVYSLSVQDICKEMEELSKAYMDGPETDAPVAVVGFLIGDKPAIRAYREESRLLAEALQQLKPVLGQFQFEVEELQRQHVQKLDLQFVKDNVWEILLEVFKKQARAEQVVLTFLFAALKDTTISSARHFMRLDTRMSDKRASKMANDVRVSAGHQIMQGFLEARRNAV